MSGQHGAWVTLPASVRTTANGSYSLGVKLGLKGLNELRIVGGDSASPVFTVTVRRRTTAVRRGGGVHPGGRPRPASRHPVKNWLSPISSSLVPSPTWQS
ncbi:hypothetical protein ATKI12_5711 [Kitasatospora sp. Ki12]